MTDYDKRRRANNFANLLIAVILFWLCYLVSMGIGELTQQHFTWHVPAMLFSVVLIITMIKRA